MKVFQMEEEQVQDPTVFAGPGDAPAGQVALDVAASSLLQIGTKNAASMASPPPPPEPAPAPPEPRKPDIKTGFRGKSVSSVPLPETELLDNPLFAKAEVDRANDGRRRPRGMAAVLASRGGSRAASRGTRGREPSDDPPSPPSAPPADPEGIRPHVYRPRGSASAGTKRRAVSMASAPGGSADGSDDGEEDVVRVSLDAESSRIVRRRERNALAAQRSRERKRLYTEKLENRIADLEAYVGQLEGMVRQLGGQPPGMAPRARQASEAEGWKAAGGSPSPPPGGAGADPALAEAIAQTTARLESEFARRMEEMEKEYKGAAQRIGKPDE
ncbi:hypothetical protein DFJ74DRAFT_658814 [Hyaloraphidium curvatum]|nr:hypothetical protein DFJ74DRAFT_658814 [Hyaloraphidium curvatum]